MKLYIGGSSQDMPRVLAQVEYIKSKSDIEIVSNWIQDLAIEGSANRDDIGHSARYSLAYRDKVELSQADWLWMLMPPAGCISHGAFWEFGYAAALKISVCISGAGQHRSIFTALATMRFIDDVMAASFLVSLR